jgi:hypothetical protein
MREKGFCCLVIFLLMNCSMAGALSELPAVVKHPILFVTHAQYQRDHHNTHDFFPSAQHEFNQGKFVPGSAMKILHPETGKTTTLLETGTGLIRDPEIHFDAQKVVFSMRRDLQDSYHIYEMNMDGTGLQQLTRMKDVDDLDPIYLPDNHILFTSTREPKYCLCNRHIMANLYRMDADGANIVQISKNPLFDNKASLMPSGRILYTRWEYVDREQLSAQGLWVANPDGTNHRLFYGNNTQSPGGVLDGRIIGDSEQMAVCTFAATHDRAWGAIAIINRARGIEAEKPVVKIWPANAYPWIKEVGSCDTFAQCNPKYEDPYPLVDPALKTAGRYFLCVRSMESKEKTAIVLLDTEGPETILYQEQGPLGCFDPQVVVPKERPPVISTQRRFDRTLKGAFYIADVYNGTHMKGIEKGEIKYLRVIETPEKRFFTLNHYWTAPANNWHEFNLKKILGTVPVEEDGSAYFTIPSETFVYFQLLDKDGMMVHSMRSGTYVQPGETQGCIGCHEDRLSTPTMNISEKTIAMRKPPVDLNGWQGPAENFSYMKTIQPVLDKHCVKCHDYGKEGAKKVVLAGDKSVPFNISYMELHCNRLLGVIGAGPVPIMQPKTWGSHCSKLISLLKKGHQKVSLSKEEMDRLTTWVDINAPYYPSYGCAFPDNVTGRCPLNREELAKLEKLSGRKLVETFHKWFGMQRKDLCLSFDRPECSVILDSITQDKKAEALEIIRIGAARMKATPRADMPGFKLSEIDAWREEKYQKRVAHEQAVREACSTGKKIYD